MVLDALVRIDVPVEVASLGKRCRTPNVVADVGPLLCVAAQVLEELLNILHGDSTLYASLRHDNMRALKELERVVLELGRKRVNQEVSARWHEVFVAVLHSVKMQAVHDRHLLVFGQLPFVHKLLCEYVLAFERLQFAEGTSVALHIGDVKQVIQTRARGDR